MSLDQKMLKELTNIFQSELAESSVVITNDLLVLEKGVADLSERKKIMEEIFRSAHNLKGASRGLGISNVGEIAHHLESLFSKIINNEASVSNKVIDICLDAVDKMREAANSYINNTPINYDIQELLTRISDADADPIEQTALPDAPKSIEKSVVKSSPAIKNESDYLRVQLNKIEQLSSVMEEIQASKISMADHFIELKSLHNAINQYLQEWKVIPALSQSSSKRFLHDMHDVTQIASQVQHDFNKKLNTFSVAANRLQDEISMLRLVPASVLLFTLPRYIRDLSQDLNKEIDLDVKGEDVKIDKLVLDGLKDPINHLLRNALDHGIEDKATRLAANKSEVGHISIEFKDMGNEIIIILSDDGGGIDRKIVSDSAEKKKLFTRDELNAMSESEIFDIIFLAGFSTKAMVTNISGRGVGLDVVKSNLVGLKGHISVESRLGVGTTFTLRVPLTLSSERGLFVQCGDQKVVIPTNYIQHVMLCDAEELVSVSGGQAIFFDKKTIPCCRLSNVLAIQSFNADNDGFPTIIVSNSNYTIAFFVDKILGEREIIVKSFQEPLNNIKYISGATLLEHNELATVLNIDDLISEALNTNQNVYVQDSMPKKSIDEKVHILVVDDSITTRTLEKNILESKNYKVTTAVNGQEAWELLQKNQYNLMITDINMPIMDGFTLTDRVKQNDKLREMPVIIVTSLGSDVEKSRGVEVGADAYIVKSEFESSSLLDVIEQLVQS